MKLFDRSVDLAQFDEDSPLYPICRAWIRNQPGTRGLTMGQRTPSPDPEVSSSQDDEVSILALLTLEILISSICCW